MSNAILSVAVIRPRIWNAVDALYDLVKYAQHSGSRLLGFPVLQPNSISGIALDLNPSGTDLATAAVEQIDTQKRERARAFLDAFWMAAQPLCQIADQATLDFLAASAPPSSVNWAGISELSPVRWFLRICCTILNILNAAATLPQDQQDGTVVRVAAWQADHWHIIRDQLAGLALPDEDYLTAHLEQALACAADRQRVEAQLAPVTSAPPVEVHRVPGEDTEQPQLVCRPNEERDRWMVALWTDGKTTKQIYCELGKVVVERHWIKLGSPNAVWNSIHAWYERNGRSMPRRKGGN